jgi:23S rRNA (cytidine1920-2'-O)/16S rRNA (cytidine1409-2'-O)-methyltransferase
MTKRADIRLVELGLARSRTAAQRLIEAGAVLDEVGCPIKASSQQVSSEAGLRLDPDHPASHSTQRFVSRGGLKLWGALETLSVRHAALVNLRSGGVALDVGQSTGGFTDALLQWGLSRVVGLDVGHGQLNSRLRADPRVVCREGVNARLLNEPGFCGDLLGDALDAQGPHINSGFDLIVADLSFISLTYIFPGVLTVLRPGASLLALVKPQFELSSRDLDRRGVVRSSEAERLHRHVEERVRAAVQAAGGVTDEFIESSITGSDGNREFFILAGRLSESTSPA